MEGEDDREETKDLIEERCAELFSEESVERDLQFYFNQYEGLILKSLQILLRRYHFFVFICLASFLLHFSLMRSIHEDQNVILHLHNYSDLKDQTVFLAIPNEPWYERKAALMKQYLSEQFPLINLQILKNITRDRQFDTFLSS